MKELVRFLVEALVDHPEAVELYEVEGDRTTILELKVDPSDVGKVIGRQGKTANALRTLLKAHASRERKRVVLEIIEANNGESKRASGGEDVE